jgi:hypothetical protein
MKKIQFRALCNVFTGMAEWRQIKAGTIVELVGASVKLDYVRIASPDSDDGVVVALSPAMLTACFDRLLNVRDNG